MCKQVEKTCQGQWMSEEYKPGLVSVIIPTYNRADLVGRAIQSVLDQTYQNYEIIVVDDDSQDNTREVVERFTDKRVRYIHLEKNMGAGAARNKGIKASRGKYIGFQDSDDEWLPEKLRKQINILDSSASTVGYVYSDMWQVDLNGGEQYWPSPTIVQGKIINEQSLDYQVRRLGIQTTLIRRECFEKVGVFDENFPRLIDLEFFLRLSKLFDSYHIKEPLVQFQPQTDGISSNIRAGSIGRILLLEKYYDDVRKNRKFVANQYLLISKSFYSCGNVAEGGRYLLKAIAACPLYGRSLSFSFKVLFGEDLHRKLLRYLRRTGKSSGDVLTNTRRKANSR